MIGLGNPLMGDDAAGLVALERLREAYAFPDDVLLMDGGTWGMNLLPVIESANRLLFLDAIRHRARPGETVLLQREQIPVALSLKLSPHQVDLKDVLALALLRGTLPHDTVAVGLEPERVELEIALSPRVAAGIDRVVALAASQLLAWGHACVPTEPAHA